HQNRCPTMIRRGMIPRHLVIGVGAMVLVVLLMGIYVWYMRGRAAELPAAQTDTRPFTAPVAGPTEQITLYVAHDNPGILRPQSARIPLPSGRQQRAEELLRALVNVYLDSASPHLLPRGDTIRSYLLVHPTLLFIVSHFYIVIW